MLNRLFILLIGIAFVGCDQNTSFDKEQWSREVNGEYSIRELMIDDIRTNHIKQGMSDDEVIKLLGKPDVGDTRQSPYSFEYGYKKEGVKCWTLRFEFDDDSLVTEAKLNTFDKWD